MAKGTTEQRLDVVRRALRHWDPIGVVEDKANGTGEGDGEYDIYATGLLGSIENGSDGYRLARHLCGIRHVSMAVGVSDPSEREENIAEKLEAWRVSGYSVEPDFEFMRYGFERRE